MPPPLYCVKTGKKYESKDEMLKLRRINDNKKQKIRYWRKHYKYDLTIIIYFIYYHEFFLI